MAVPTRCPTTGEAEAGEWRVQGHRRIIERDPVSKHQKLRQADRQTHRHTGLMLRERKKLMSKGSICVTPSSG